ncbi:hypothetical protein BM449_12910 [Synechococcus sp. SynAce01]|nr:hypothetical protein BM449_12910 [Synechococcus sp. SynAce01]
MLETTGWPSTVASALERVRRPLGLAIGIGGALAMLLLSAALADQQRLQLRCRTDQGPWQACVMRIEAVGERWSLELPDDSFDFRHDGSGIVEMSRAGAGQWRPVTSQWSPEHALCWNGLCALGQFPLD